ncbi:MAG: hypothetical protein RL759_1743, partial [Verrucomicrobiota bacterium]
PETAEEKEMKALAAEFLAGIQPVEAAGNQVTLTAKWETLKLFGMLEKIVAIGATKAKSAPQPLTTYGVAERPRGGHVGTGNRCEAAGRAGHPWPAAVEQGCSTLPDAERPNSKGAP